jgi:hypothetical protein
VEQVAGGTKVPEVAVLMLMMGSESEVLIAARNHGMLEEDKKQQGEQVEEDKKQEEQVEEVPLKGYLMEGVVEAPLKGYLMEGVVEELLPYRWQDTWQQTGSQSE